MMKSPRIVARTLVLLGFLALSNPLMAADKTGQAAALEAKAPTLAQMLTWAIQDEWAARAEYKVVLAKWPNAKPFVNIIKAEESHIAWLTPLFAKNGLPFPVEPKAATLVPTDWAKALAVGAEAEVLNIAMYDKFLKQPLPDDVRAVFEELKRGSENHLRAFRGGGGNGNGGGGH